MNIQPLQYHYATLANGMRVVMCHAPMAVAAHCGVTVRAGSRDEQPDRYGLAHFVEHTIFKGTLRRRAWHILNRMERIGGELNAYTTKEETVVYTTYPAGYLERAVDLLADLIENSQFPANELERERQVVEDEIDSYLDSPAEGIFDDFDELIFAGTPLAHPILGNRKSIASLDTAICRQWLDDFYRPDNMVLFYYGPETPDRVVTMAGRYFTAKAPDTPVSRPPCIISEPAHPIDRTRAINSHQAHTVLGTKVPDMYHDDRFALALLTNMLGGPGMNSLLNVALREKRGLVYTVDASTALMSDTGLFTIYYGCDREDVDRCRRIITDILGNALEAALTPRRLAEACRQYEGQLIIASTNTEQQALAMGRATLMRGEVMPMRKQLEAINSLTPATLIDTARRLMPLSRLTLE